MSLKVGLFAAASTVAVLACTPASAVVVASNAISPTLIGSVVSGTTYTLTIAGQSNIYASFNGGAGLTFTADGKPTYAFPAPYAAFNPNGLSYDPTQSNPGGGSYTYCAGGSVLLCGALIGTYSPTGVGGYFQLGGLNTFTASQTGSLYGLVNDVTNGYYDNAATGFSVRISAVTTGAVPEPAAWAMMISGFGLVGMSLRQRRRSRVVFV